MKELHRERYLSRIRPFYHERDLVKALAGVRGSGKSTILRQIAAELSEDTVAVVACLDLESDEHRGVKDQKDLMDAIDEILPPAGDRRYLIVDEAQRVDGFERVVNAYRNDGVSVFIAGSNTHLLDGEQATNLTGRYVGFRILPFSFSEVRDFAILNGLHFDRNAGFASYVRDGGFPGLLQPGVDRGKYIEGLVRESVERDVLPFGKVRGRSVLGSLLRHLVSAPASTVSTPTVSSRLGEEGIRIKPDTVGRYLDLLFGSMLVSCCLRYDIGHGCGLKTLYRLYVADPALNTYLGGDGETDTRAVLENIVHNELVSRGYVVSIGKMGRTEAGFVVCHGDRRAYVRVADFLSDRDAAEREFGVLLGIKDAYPKYLVTMDPITSDYNGVRHLNLVDDFLLGDGFSL